MLLKPRSSHPLAGTFSGRSFRFLFTKFCRGAWLYDEPAKKSIVKVVAQFSRTRYHRQSALDMKAALAIRFALPYL